MTDIDRISRHCASLLIENENLKIRIEKLEAALNRIANLTERWEHDLISQVNEVAREALEGKDER